MPDDPHPVAFHQRADDIGADGNAADLLDFAARDRLAIGDKGQRLEQRSRIPRRALFPELLQPVDHRGLDLHAEPRCDLGDYEASLLVFFVERRNGRPDFGFLRRHTLVEQALQLIDVERSAGGEQRGFDKVFDFNLVH